MAVSKHRRKSFYQKKKSHKSVKAPLPDIQLLSMGIKDFNKARETIRTMARTYVVLTKKIPGYKETDPDVMVGLREGIPILKEIDLRYTKLNVDFTAYKQKNTLTPPTIIVLLQELESLSYLLAHDFIGHFVPLVNAVERVAQALNATEIVSESNALIHTLTSTFTTDLR